MTFRDGDRPIAARDRTFSDHELRAELNRAQILLGFFGAAVALRLAFGSGSESGGAGSCSAVAIL